MSATDSSQHHIHLRDGMVGLEAGLWTQLRLILDRAGMEVKFIGVQGSSRKNFPYRYTSRMTTSF